MMTSDILLCSDGLTNFVKPDEILKIIGESEFFDFADKLVNNANMNGGADNITVVAVSN